MLDIATHSDTRVRIACADDAESLLNMCRMMHHETAVRNGIKPPPFDATKTRQTLEMALPYGRNDFDSGCAWIGVIGDPGEIKASSCLKVDTPLFSSVPFLRNLWMFVQPEHRTESRNIRDLVAFGQSRSKQLQMSLVVDAMMVGPGLERLYDRSGFQRVGSFYSFDGASP